MDFADFADFTAGLGATFFAGAFFAADLDLEGAGFLTGFAGTDFFALFVLLAIGSSSNRLGGER